MIGADLPCFIMLSISEFIDRCSIICFCDIQCRLILLYTIDRCVDGSQYLSCVLDLRRHQCTASFIVTIRIKCGSDLIACILRLQLIADPVGVLCIDCSQYGVRIIVLIDSLQDPDTGKILRIILRAFHIEGDRFLDLFCSGYCDLTASRDW